jgi:Zn-dependent M16 (insulinase) family peptidase
VGLKGVAEEDVDAVAGLVQATLEKVAEEGFPRERVDAIMHQVTPSLTPFSTATHFLLIICH